MTLAVTRHLQVLWYRVVQIQLGPLLEVSSKYDSDVNDKQYESERDIPIALKAVVRCRFPLPSSSPSSAAGLDFEPLCTKVFWCPERTEGYYSFGSSSPLLRDSVHE